MAKRLISFLNDRAGASVVEYGLIAAVLSLTIIAGVGSAGEAYQNMFTDLATWFNTGEMP